jgi:hypothetical protein
VPKKHWQTVQSIRASEHLKTTRRWPGTCVSAARRDAVPGLPCSGALPDINAACMQNPVVCRWLIGSWTVVDERLRADNDRQSEAFGVVGLGFGGVNHDPEIVGGDDQRVAVEGDAAYAGVVDDLAPALVVVRFEFAGLPKLDESRALHGEFADQSIQPWIAGISGSGQAQVGDQSSLQVGMLVGGGDGAAAWPDEVPPDAVAFDSPPARGLAH